MQRDAVLQSFFEIFSGFSIAALYFLIKYVQQQIYAGNPGKQAHRIINY
jgi:hypothetical protein